MTRPAATPTPPEDDLDELPPLDGEDEADADPDYQDLLDPNDDDGDGPLDDRTAADAEADAADDAKELDTEDRESGWLEDAEDADELDVGTDLALFDGDAAAGGDFEELGVGEEDFGLVGGAEDAAGLDGGEEGPGSDDEEMREADLPPLDADEEGEMDEADLLESSFGEALEATLPRAARAWSPVGAPLDLAETTAVVCADRGAVVAALARSPSLVRVDLEGACEPLAASSARRLVAAAGLLAVVGEDGRVRASDDGGATLVLVEGASDVDEVALAAGELWVRSRAGKVLRTADLGKTWDAPIGAARTLALSGDGARVVALVREPGGTTRLVDVTRVASTGGGDARRAEVSERDALPDEVAGQVGVSALLAVRGEAVACAGDSRGLSRLLGARWTTLDNVGRVTALTFLDDEGSLLAAASASEGDASWLVHVDVAGDARIVAELDPPAGEGREPEAVVRAIARDEAHGVVWVAGAFGLLAFEVP